MNSVVVGAKDDRSQTKQSVNLNYNEEKAVVDELARKLYKVLEVS